MAITADLCREILTVERPYHRMRQRDWDMLLLFAQAWLDHEAQVAKLEASETALNEYIERLLKCEAALKTELATLRQQLAEARAENERLKAVLEAKVNQVGGRL